MQVSKLSVASTILFLVFHAHAESPLSLNPILAVPDQVVLENDFSDASQLRKDHWRPNMGTRWSVTEGVLRGIPSTVEYHDSMKVAETKELTYEPGRWYHALAELKGDEFVIQFADGPTLYAKDPSYALPPPSGAPGMGIAGPKGGVAEIDNVTIWSIKSAAQSGWAARQKEFAKFEPVQVKEKPVKRINAVPSNK